MTTKSARGRVSASGHHYLCTPNLNTTLNTLRHELQLLKLDESLLFLNHLLAGSRPEFSQVRDEALQRALGSLSCALPAFVVHFLAKWLLLESSNLGPRCMCWDHFRRLWDLFFKIRDPSVAGPGWASADPSGFTARQFAFQIPCQIQVPEREFGLALGLFQADATGTAGSATASGLRDVRADLEKEIGMAIEDFMRLAYVCSLPLKINGCYRHGIIAPCSLAAHCARAYPFLTPENLGLFLNKVACTRDQFRQMCNREEFRCKDERFLLYAFNPLLARPLVQLHPDLYVAVDPLLIARRATLGLFFDLFGRERTAFSQRFGEFVLPPFVYALLNSVMPTTSLWSEATSPLIRSHNDPEGKRGDVAYKGRTRTVLIDCKSLRPSLELTTLASEEALDKMAVRVAEALEQLIDHHAAINRSEWSDDGLLPGGAIYVVLTFGRVHSINTPSFRNRIRKSLDALGKSADLFLVLSLEELDMAVRLVELGDELDRVMEIVAWEQSDVGLEGAFQEKLFPAGERGKSVSRFTSEKYRDFVTNLIGGRQNPT